MPMATTSVSSPGMTFTCPMHPEVQAEKPGFCPKCGMALEPVEISSVSDRTEYTCPMHPEIVRDQPGNCPVCGMALEPRDVSVGSANPELANMTRRFWVAIELTLPLRDLDRFESHPALRTGTRLFRLHLRVHWAGEPHSGSGTRSRCIGHDDLLTESPKLSDLYLRGHRDKRLCCSGHAGGSYCASSAPAFASFPRKRSSGWTWADGRPRIELLSAGSPQGDILILRGSRRSTRRCRGTTGCGG